LKEEMHSMSWMRIRQTVFQCGLVALAISIAVLLGSYLKPVRSTDYMQQFYEALPWLRWGTASALLGFMLSFFGQRRPRVAAVSGAFLLSAFWMMLGASSL
jgi:hypothetical protein